MTDEAAPPKPTAQDRATLRYRIKSLLDRKGTSGRRAEEHLNLATGSLAKIYSGRIQFTRQHLADLSKLLGVMPDEIVVGTAFERLLTASVSSPEQAAAADLAEEISRLRVELEARDAALGQQREEAGLAIRDRERLKRELADAEARAAKTESELVAEHEKSKALARALEQSSRERQAADHQRRTAEENLAAERARLQATQNDATAWRAAAIEHNGRADHLLAYAYDLEQKLAAARGEADQARSSKGNAALGAGFLAFVAGALLSDGGSKG